MLVQSLAVPLVLKGSNLVCVAETGSGKTLAFLLPAIIQIMRFYKRKFQEFEWDDFMEPQDKIFREQVVNTEEQRRLSVLILVPSKELAIQIYTVVMGVIRKTHVRASILLSEDSKFEQFKVCQDYLYWMDSRDTGGVRVLQRLH